MLVLDYELRFGLRYLIIRDFQLVPSSIDWEIKEWEFRVILRLKLVDGKLIAASHSAPAHNDKASSGLLQVDIEHVAMKKIAIVYDAFMLKHKHPTQRIYADKPTRVSAIWERLWSCGITSR